MSEKPPYSPEPGSLRIFRFRKQDTQVVLGHCGEKQQPEYILVGFFADQLIGNERLGYRAQRDEYVAEQQVIEKREDRSFRCV
jgi:hypothetical protein